MEKAKQIDQSGGSVEDDPGGSGSSAKGKWLLSRP